MGWIELAGIALSLIAVVIAVMANHIEDRGVKKDTRAVFANLWFDLDQIFIEYPKMHKYFYDHSTNNVEGRHEVTPIDMDMDSEDFERALCIAERIVDTFQYAELFIDSLEEKDRVSYQKYKEKMFSSDFMKNVVRPIWENNGSEWIKM